jgi:hypothetical protein
MGFGDELKVSHAKGKVITNNVAVLAIENFVFKRLKLTKIFYTTAARSLLQTYGNESY